MILRNISLSEFKIRVDDTFNIESDDWHSRLNKWVLQAIGLISSNVLYNPVAVKFPFVDSILHMPLDIKVLTGITYEGFRLLPTSDSVLGVTTTVVEPYDKYYFLGATPADDVKLIVDPSDKPIEMKLPTTVSQEVYTESSRIVEKSYTYTVQRNDIIKLNLPESSGDVIVFYKTLSYRLNEDGTIEMVIPDNEYLLEALEWYMLKRLIGRGYKHHVFDYNYADAQWTVWRKKARKSVNSMSLDQREVASNIFRNFVMDYEKWYKL